MFHRSHKPRQCCIVSYTVPSPTGLPSPPHTLVNAPSSVDVPSPVHGRRPPSRLHHSLYRRFPRPRSIVPSLVRDAFAVRAVPSPGPQVYHRYHTPPSTLHRSFSRGVTVVPFPVDAAPPHPPLGYRRPFPRACSPPFPLPTSHHRPIARGLPSSLSLPRRVTVVSSPVHGLLPP